MAICLILLMQGPAMLVQEVAWVNMLISYTQERGLKRGVIETFDGEHPCGLCKKADSIRQQDDGESRKPALPPEVRANFAWMPMMIPSGVFITPAPRVCDLTVLPAPWHKEIAEPFADDPDTPPPKRV